MLSGHVRRMTEDYYALDLLERRIFLEALSTAKVEGSLRVRIGLLQAGFWSSRGCAVGPNVPLKLDKLREVIQL